MILARGVPCYYQYMNATVMVYAGVIIVSLGFAWLLAYIARRRGVSPVFWGVMGFAFGPLALPFVFLFRKKRARKLHEQTRQGKRRRI